MSDAGFVIAAYAVILGGIAAYAALLARRLGRRPSASADIVPPAPDAPR
ncbi:MAG: hypothetical protein M3R32_03715 [Chloroflexota bacterium]|nr:hypothetical protein [Chloroflexota bacterium]